MNKDCMHCEYCIYLEEGDIMCAITHKLVIIDWSPSEYYCACKGKAKDKRIKNNKTKKGE